MTLFPLIKGKAELALTRAELYQHLRNVCEEDLPLVHMVSNSFIEPAYGFEWYDDSFIIWKVPPSGPLSTWLFTTIHGTIKNGAEGLTINYHIRYNIWSNFLTLIAAIGFVYLPYRAFANLENIDWLMLIVGLALYPLSILNFKDSASENLKFVEELKKRFANKTYEQC